MAQSNITAPRSGESFGFAIYPDASTEFTVGQPEAITWSSIRHYCSERAAEFYLRTIYGIAHKKKRADMAWNLRLYIQQAYEFYEAAANAKPNTAPLFYYYSFLNLAKAICETKSPRLHLRAECYAHGLAWKPPRRRLVKFAKDTVRIRGRGVWHLLWETLMRRPCPAVDNTKLRVLRLFSFCRGISSEYNTIFGEPKSLLPLSTVNALRDSKTDETWLALSVERQRLHSYGLTGLNLVRQIGTAYAEVKSDSNETRSFESAWPVKIANGKSLHSALRNDILNLNLFTQFSEESEIEYWFPLQRRLPVQLPQIMVSYTILFWLGSLVRYDPHSVYDLMNSEFWILIDGFMTQSRPWLLELFRWALYQKEITLRTAR